MTATNTTKTSKKEKITGRITAYLMRDNDTGFAITKMGNVTVIFPAGSPGDGVTLEVEGDWVTHPRYGKQLKAFSWREVLPEDLLGIKRYLVHHLDGVGEAMAAKIVDRFGASTLEVLKRSPDKLLEIPGIKGKKYEGIVESLKDRDKQKIGQELLTILYELGISPAYVAKIHKKFGDASLDVVRNHPYRLIEIKGIGFKKADEIGRGVRIAPDSLERILAAILYVLESAEDNGHCYLPKEDLMAPAVEALSFPGFAPSPHLIEMGIKTLLADGKLVMEYGERVMLTPMQKMEIYIADRIKEMAEFSPPVPELGEEDSIASLPLRIQKAIANSGMTINFDFVQLQAIWAAEEGQILILTGGPGTGKTTISRAIISLWESQGKRVVLASPTGKAAKRLESSTGREAKTIHRLLEWKGSFQRNEEFPLDADAILIDEISMVSLSLFHSLLKAVRRGAQLLLVGDSNQLPSVGAGQVLADLISSGKVPVVELKQIHRQGEGSEIVFASHQVINGSVPAFNDLSPSIPPYSDCHIIRCMKPTTGADWVRWLLSSYFPSLGYKSSDVQILSLGHRSEVGTIELNKLAQSILNPPSSDKESLAFGDVTFREGDRVMQVVNDYGKPIVSDYRRPDIGKETKEIFNGDQGTIVSVRKQRVIVDFEGTYFVYEGSDLSELKHAYAISVHKSQGSEFPILVLAIFTQHFTLLNRQIFYTGITRAKDRLFIVGQDLAIKTAVATWKNESRFTRLAARISSP